MAARSRTAGRALGLTLILLVVSFGLVALVGTATPERGLDLTDGARLTFAPEGGTSAAELDRAAEVVADRLEDAGVHGARVRAEGADALVVEHPGDARSDVAGLVSREGRLRIRVVAQSGPGSVATPPGETDAAPGEGDESDAAPDEGDETDAAPDGSASEDDPAAPDADGGDPVDYGDPVLWAVSPDPASVEAYNAFTCGAAGESTTDEGGADADVADRPYVACDASGTKYLLSPVIVDGERLSDASARVAQGSTQWGVRLRFDDEGSRAFGEMSRILAGTQRLFAVVLDGQVVQAPRMTSVVANGEANITGNYTEADARALATSLDSGTLPVTLSATPDVEPIAADLDPGKALTWGAVGAALLLLVALGLAALHRGPGLVVAAAVIVTSAFSYALLVLLGQGVGLLLSAASLAGLLPAVVLSGRAATNLLTAIGVGVARGQSLAFATDSVVARSRATVALAAALPATVAVVGYVVLRGPLSDFALTLAISVVVAVSVHAVFTTSLAQWLAGASDAGRRVSLPSLAISGARSRGYAAVGLILALGVVGLVIGRPTATEEISGAAGQTSLRWALAGLLLVLVVAAALFTYRFGSWRFAAAGLVAVVVDVAAVLGLVGLFGMPLGHSAVAALLAVLAVSLSDKVLAFDAVEHPVQGLSDKRRSLTQAVDEAVRGLLAQGIPYAALVGVPLLALAITAAFLGGLVQLTEVAVVLLLGVGISFGTSTLLAVPLLVDLRARVQHVRASAPRPQAGRTAAATPRRTPAPKASRPASPTTPAGRGPVRQSGSAKRPQPSRQTRSKRGKK
ncbi:hypothetical protein [Nocardioides sp.]|uniref:SecDF P1 head subdomain-containing protein n=1 Tax=Nocardioides sp. TaxID=35761 RepID=UPI0027331EA2|nr:hypothetical protein [Nocardioides sp.]MDP3893221.1 hypothetical protein [Nocardioides sp.]